MRFLLAFLLLLLAATPASAFLRGSGVGAAATVTLASTDRAQVEGYTNQLLASRPSAYVTGEFRVSMMAVKYSITNPQFIFPNWGVSGGDQPGPNNITIQAAYEISGVSTPLTFQGATSVTLTPGQNAISDPLPITIPVETMFYIRTGVQVPNTSDSFYDGVQNGDDVFTPSSLPAQVNNTGVLTVAGNESQLTFYSYLPLEVLGQMKTGAISVGLYGDSIAQGVGDTTPGTDFDLGFLTKGLRAASAGSLPNTNYSRAFEDLVSGIGVYRAADAKYHTHCIVELGTNNLGGSSNLSALETLYLSAWSALKKNGCSYVAQTTLFPRTTSWADQTPFNSDYSQGGIKDQLNAWFLTQVGTTLNAVIDGASTVQNPTNSAQWNTSGAQLSGDGTHPNTAGVTLALVPVTNWANSIPSASGG